MIIRPARRKQDTVRPALLVDEAHARDLDDGTVWPLDRLPKTLRAYVSWDDADRYARAGTGELVCWGDEPIRYRHTRHGDSHRRRSDAVIVKLPVDTRPALERGLVEWADWLVGHGVNPGWSLGGTSMNLLRHTLDAPLVTTNGELSAPRWTLGGRQQCWVEPGTVVRGAVQLDLPAAYTHVVGQLRYGGVWRALDGPEAAPAKLERYHAAGYPVLVRARVGLPDLDVGPLAKRPQRRPDSRIEEIAPTVPYPVSGRLAGTWTYGELRQALAAGAVVRAVCAWVHVGADRPFERWHEAVMDGRESLDGFGALLAKATGNALWGQFVIDDHKRLRVQRWNGGYSSLPVQGSRGHQKRAWDVGELVCGAVRAKLYRALALTSGSLVCAHTDGLWVRDSYAAESARAGLEEEGWRVKSEASELHVLDQQKYRYRLRRARTFQVVCAGVPSHRAADTFGELWGRFA